MTWERGGVGGEKDEGVICNTQKRFRPKLGGGPSLSRRKGTLPIPTRLHRPREPPPRSAPQTPLHLPNRSRSELSRAEQEVPPVVNQLRLTVTDQCYPGSDELRLHPSADP